KRVEAVTYENQKQRGDLAFPTAEKHSSAFRVQTGSKYPHTNTRNTIAAGRKLANAPAQEQNQIIERLVRRQRIVPQVVYAKLAIRPTRPRSCQRSSYGAGMR